ncbi:diacylglycerol/lipid kinase family protein [Levilactobacillus spicheri]|uniref:Diacylglycerol kinase n=2 Tax=Levilactobacillus spicheri TaxID=216463 RepID=A0ABQ0WMD0_9LACO|nr:YegS/Rv2252/BmrU family lipid kinase [Levilactobacillus spicheri]KRL50311.1 diacylglycerol kinase family protein [Levilactobacillus spicheri DSM 15429]GEO66177.1 diacylglycerol kinase [Levilactobacillus spicheri]
MVSVQYYIILNEHAGSGRAGNLWPEIRQRLDAAQVRYQVATSDYANHAILLSEQFAKQLPDDGQQNWVVLAVGGDGTLHETLNGLTRQPRQHPIPVAYLPVGSGNDFARGIGMSLNWETALKQVIDCTQATDYDLGTYDETIKQERGVFTNNLGIGFDAGIIAQANQSKAKIWLNKHHLGSLSYLASALNVYYNQTGFTLTVHVGNQRDIYPNAFLVTTTNHPYFGGGVPIVPTATLTDHQLHLVVIEKPNFFKLIWLALRLIFKRHLTSKAVHYYAASTIHLTVPAIEYGQLDGEEMGGRFFDVYTGLRQYPFWIDVTL